MRLARSTAIAGCATIIWLLLAPNRALGQVRGEYLEPEDGAFSPYPLNSYYTAVSEALLGRDRDRICQMVFLPSFELEAAVFIVPTREQKEVPLVVAVEAERQIWYQMLKHLHGFESEENQQRALALFPRRVRRVMRGIDRPTSVLLSSAWEAMLARVTYQGAPTLGFDGATYHAAHRSGAQPFAAGKVWSPPAGTAAHEFVALAQTLRAYAGANDNTAEALKQTLITQAQALLARLRVSASK